jgi:hypothetical protein
MTVLPALFAFGGLATSAILSLAGVEARTGTGPEVTAAGQPRRLAAYPLLVAAGCTPILELHADGSIDSRGCPTNACGPNNGCQQQSGAGGSTKCGCITDVPGAVLCEGIVTYNPDGTVNDWDCFKEDCNADCTKTQAPPAPGRFFACNC